jgi:hypothetical protein
MFSTHNFSTNADTAFQHSRCIDSPNFIQENGMTQRIGNKDEAQQRSKHEKLEAHKSNVSREAVKKAEAKSKNRNAVKGAKESTESQERPPGLSKG